MTQVQRAYYAGFSTTLADATRIPAPLWVTPLFLIGLYFIRREKFSAATAAALGVGAVNPGLIMILSLLALAHFKPAAQRATDIDVALGQSRSFYLLAHS